jgi:hypothetical protein
VSFVTNASQRDKNVIAESQYYYESKTIIANRDSEEEGRNAGEENNCINFISGSSIPTSTYLLIYLSDRRVLL